MTRDLPKALEYYGTMCGWAVDTMPDPDADGPTLTARRWRPDAGGMYHIAQKDGQPVAGLMDIRAMEQLNGVPAHWFTYIAVDDVDAAVEATVAAGGEIRRPCCDVLGIGRIAIIADPIGAAVGIMSPDTPANS